MFTYPAQCRPRSTLECGARRACSRRAGVSFSSAFQSHASFIFNFALHQEQASCPEGSEHRASGLRMAPGDVAHVPRTPSPVAEAGPVARHFRSRARLCRLLVRLRRPTLHRSLRSLRQGGFAHYVRLRHYRSSLLAAASKSLTFVRGADRACWAPRKWPWKPTNACLYWLPARPPQGALACAPGSGTLPPA